MPQARYVMIGGFLGAGKTTAILKFAEYLKHRGTRVGLIHNDQSIDLVDTARARASGFAVEEITGGCFCCKFDSLVEAAGALTRQTAPEVLVAEPVGSCTDLIATVSYPLRKLYGDHYHVAALSVLVDPLRCGRILGIFKEGKSFSKNVVYVYRKQLEEAEIIVINKIDLLDAEKRQLLAAGLRAEFPHAQVVEISTATGEGMQTWFDLLMSGELGHRPPMEVDYDTYADGEALLGWLNAKVELQADEDFDGNALLIDLSTQLRDRLASHNIEIAHLKVMLTPNAGNDLGAISLTRTQGQPHATHQLAADLSRGSLIINLRAEADADLLKQQVSETIAEISGIKTDIRQLAAFQPCRPTPTHRFGQSTTPVECGSR